MVISKSIFIFIALVLVCVAKDRLILISDPGVDDSAAIMLSIAQAQIKGDDIEVLGCVSSYGVVNGTVAARNMLVVLEAVGAHQIPSFIGNTYPLRPIPENGRVAPSRGLDFHGPHGLGLDGHSYFNDILDLKKQKDIMDKNQLSGVEFILQKVREYPGEVSILCFSPATTLAVTLMVSPAELTAKLKSVHLMGGALNEAGNVTPLAESNFYQDPLAAEIVLSSFQEFGYGGKVVISPLDVTLKAVFTETELNKALQHSRAGNWYVTKVIPYYLQSYAIITNGMPLHDTHPVAHFMMPHLYRGARLDGLHVDTMLGSAAYGMMYYDRREWVKGTAMAADRETVKQESDEEKVNICSVSDRYEGNAPLVLLDIDENKFKTFVLEQLAILL